MQSQRNRISGVGKARVMVLRALIFALLAIPAMACAGEVPLIQGWNLISMPAPPDVAAAASLKLEFFRVSGGDYEAVSAEKIQPGYGYWVFSPQNATLRIADEAPSSQVTIQLKRGWNAVGNPFSQTVPWGSNVRVTTRLGQVPVAESGMVTGKLVQFSSLTGQYEQIVQNEQLEPYRAYLVRVKEDCDVVINLQQSGGGEPVVEPISALPFDGEAVAVDPGTGRAIVTDQVVVSVSGMSLSAAAAAIESEGGDIVGYNAALGLVQVRIPGSVTPADFAQTLKSSGAVADAAPVLIFEQTALPDDPIFTDSDSSNDYHFTAINAAAAWDTLGPAPAQPVIIAILDTGVNAGHEELSGRVLSGMNFADGGSDTTDRSGHGTMAAGLAAGAGSNARGAAGLCWDCRVLPVKVLDDSGQTSVFTVITGIIYAADNGAKVINLSLNGPTDHGFWEEQFIRAVNYAASKGAVVVGAAGNRGEDAGEYLPAAAPRVITAAATDANNARAAFSNYGTFIDLAAPGAQVYANNLSGYEKWSGTSVSAPLVSGAAALLAREHPQWTPGEIEQVLISTTQSVQPDQPIGTGVLNVAAALAAAPSGGSSGGGSVDPIGGSGGGTDPGMGAAAACSVTNALDSGAGSLRNCITFANANPGTTITFTFSGTISPSTALPAITAANTVIDGSGRSIMLDGSYLGFDGFKLNSNNITIKGLSLTRFYTNLSDVSAIRMTGAASHNNQVLNCRIGTNFTDNAGYYNRHGVIIESGAYDNSIGDGTTAGRNIISGNKSNGIWINDSPNNDILGNYIGITSAGTALLRNESNGVLIEGAASTGNNVGAMVMGFGYGNIISGNVGNGILLKGSSYTEIYNNIIGLAVDGVTPLANDGQGIRLESAAHHNIIGGTSNLQRNIISNNTNGIYFTGVGTDDNQVYNNYLGTDKTGKISAFNRASGVYIEAGKRNKIGGTAVFQGNVISANHGFGVLLNTVNTTDNSIQGNRIGVDVDGSSLPNTESGVGIISGPTNNIIGSSIVAENGENIIAYNQKEGIRVSGSTSINNRFFKNIIYKNDELAIDLGNDGVTPNGSGPVGPNNYINYPVLTNIVPRGGGCYDFSGTKAANSYAVIYKADYPAGSIGPDPTGYGEGYAFISVSSSAYAGTAFAYSSLCITGASTVAFLAYDSNGNTSEFGRNFRLTALPVVSNVQFTSNPIIANGFRTTVVTADVSYENGREFLQSVTANLGPVGGGVVTMYDDGAHNDGAANDGKYGSVPFTAAEGTAGPSKTIAVTATDILNNTGSGSGTLNITTLAMPADCGSDWTSFACDSANRGLSTQSLTYPLSQKWAQTSFNWPVYTSAAVTGNYVIVADAGDGFSQRGKVKGLLKSTGAVQWTYTPTLSSEAFVDNTPAVWNNSVFLSGYSGRLYSLNVTNGGENWVFSPGTGIIRGHSPVAAHDMVFVGTEGGRFYALNANTGGVVWSFTSTIAGTFEDAPSAVVNGVVYAADSNLTSRHVYALDAFTGQKYWEHTYSCGNCGIAGSGLTVSGSLVCSGSYFNNYGGGPNTSHVFCLNKYTGAEEWAKPLPANTNMGDNHGVFYGNTFIIGHYDYTGGTASGLTAYNLSGGGHVWTFTPDPGLEFYHSSPAIVGSILFVTANNTSTNRGYLYALNPSTGAKLWSQSYNYDIIANPAITDNMLILGTTDNSVIALEPGVSDPCPGSIVTSNADSGSGTLRACIEKANGTPGAETITFSISNATISPVTTLTIAASGGPLTINAQGKNIVIDGNVCTLCEGLDVLADNVTINGLAITRFKDSGHHAISVDADNVTIQNCRIGTNWAEASGLGNAGGIYIEGLSPDILDNVISGNMSVGLTLAGTNTNGATVARNYIGVKSDGNTALANQTGGVLITNGAHDNTVGGTLGTDGNVISGNDPGYGIQINGNMIGGNNNNVIHGNLIGTNASGNAAVPNAIGVYLTSVVDNTQIGGLYGTYGNIISGNRGAGIFITSTTNTAIFGNIIGLNKNGDNPLPNNYVGISISSTNGCAIGKNTPGYGNVISGNLDHGIYFLNTVSNCTIHDNIIGLRPNGVTAAGNSGDGIHLASSTSSATIGDIAGNENIIAYNGGSGINVNNSASPLYEFRGNRIFGNTGMGISSTPTYNLAVTTVTLNGANYDVSGTSTCANCSVELYRVDDTASGIGQDNATTPPAGEGFQFLGEKTTNAGGAWSFTNVAISGGGYVTALIIDTTSKTTRFAPNKQLPSDNCPGNTVTSAANSGDGTLRACIDKANGTPGAETITFTINNTTISPATTYTVQAAGGDLIIDGSGKNIVIDGASCTNCDGFTVLADDFQLKGVAVTRFNGAGKYGVKVTGNNADIRSNRIGTNFSDTAGLGNTGGIYVQGQNCYVIGNTVAGNTGVGITLDGAATNGCDIQSNYVGLKSTGAAALGNGAGGVLVQGGAHDNVIGGDIALNEGNVISGQGASAYGISITGAGSVNNTIWGNIIGLNAAGTAALPNKNGVQAFNGADGTFIGGVRASHGNVISGNSNVGVYIMSANNVTAAGNLIGLNKAGSGKIGNNIGVYASGAGTCKIGTTIAGQENYIGGNNTYGIQFVSASGCQIMSSRIGLQTDNVSAAGNTSGGIFIGSASSNITIGNTTGSGNIITFSGGHGVEISGSPPGVVVSGNSIYNNAGRGILSATDYSLAIASATPNGLNYDVSGTSVCPGCIVQLYQVDYAANGIVRDNATTPPAGEGYKYLGQTTANGAGAWSFTNITVTGGNFVTALIIDTANNTTEFAPDRWLGATPDPCGADWPMFHCNFLREARGTSSISVPLAKKWEYLTGNNIISAPAVSGGRVYFGSTDNKVYSLDSITGAKIWESTAPTQMVYGSPTVGTNLVYIGSQDDKLYALRLSDGVKQWEFPTGGDVVASPVLAGGKLIFGSYDNKVYALNPDTGAKYWEYVTGGGVAMSPAVYNGSVYAGSWDGKVYALDIDTGTKLWEYNTGGGIYGSPAAVDGVVYVSSTNDRVYALDANTGAIKWIFQTGGDVRSSPAVAYDKVYVGSWDNKVYAINAITGMQSWEFTTGGVVDSSPAVADNKVFITSDDGKMYVLSEWDGSKLYEYSMGGWSRSSPALAGGMVYFGSSDKKLHALGPHECPGNIVTTLADSGMGSLRACIIKANNEPGANTITFSVSGTIIPQSELPTLTDNATTIDGGGNITIEKPLNEEFNGIVINSDNNTIKNLTIIKFKTCYPDVLAGIRIRNADNNKIIGCKLGTDGTNNLPNDMGILLENDSKNNIIGGTTVAERNIISANEIGIDIYGAGTSNNMIYGNFIGTTENGLQGLTNLTAGINIVYATNNIIGGTSGRGNLISGNFKGIMMYGADGTKIIGNKIGTDITGTSSIGNASDGIYISGSTINTIIGGSAVDEANIIAFNVGNGISVRDSNSDFNQFINNRIFSNTSLGIYLDGTGSNNNIAAPIISTTTMTSPGVYDISGTTACAGTCKIQLFRVDDSASGVIPEDAVTPSAGEAFAFVAETNSAAGAWSFTGLGITGGQYITATVTDAANNTSQFAANKQLSTDMCAGFLVTTTADTGMGSLRECLSKAKTNPGSTIKFAAGIANGTIKPQTELPTFTANNTSIDGETRNITLDGSFPCSNCHGLVLRADGGTVKNLTIVNFNTATRSGIVIDGGIGGGRNYTITGCKIGTDGTTKKPNDYGISIVMGGQNNTIGGSGAGEANTIAGNNAQGISIAGVNSNSNFVYGNYIGTNAAGSAALGNALNGVRIVNSAQSNTIGGTGALANTIAYNGKNGVRVEGGSTDYNGILNNKIHSNTELGIDLDGAGANNNIAAPVISSTTLVSSGVYNITGTTTCAGACKVQLFRVDDTASGIGQETAVNPPAGEAFAFIAQTNSAGGAWSFSNLAITGGQYITAAVTDTSNNTSEFAENKQLSTDMCVGFVVSTLANSGVGSLRECINKANSETTNDTIIFSVSGTITPLSELPALTDNGTTINGGGNITLDGNGANFNGLVLQSNNNVIRDMNVIRFSGASKAGILIDGGDTNTIYGCKIGNDGTNARANSYGIYLNNGATWNTIGGNTSGRRNIISGNGTGIYISGAATERNKVTGNYIGTNAAGTAALANTAGGIIISGPRNTIGGGAGEGNVISGNGGAQGGIYLSTVNAQSTEIKGNYIGTNAAGTSAVPNTRGIYLISGANNTTIGGTTDPDRNIISGNTSEGILINGSTNNYAIGNYMGTTASGLSPLPNQTNVKIENGSTDNFIGGPTAATRNVIAAAAQDGVWLVSNQNSVQGNYIGVNKDGQRAAGMGNGRYGVYAQGSSNKIGGSAAGQSPNLILRSGQAGVYVTAGTLNTISENVIYDNGALGIDLVSGGNANIARPTVSYARYSSPGVADINGLSSCGSGCTVELYRADDTGAGIGADAAGGEGFAYLGKTTTAAGGTWSFTGIAFTGGDYVTATITDTNGNTSEFAANRKIVFNSPPIIISSGASSNDISFYQTITLNAAASDPDGDPLTYSWSGSGLSPFSATNTASTQWSGPLKAYTEQITLTVTDGRGGTATVVIPVRVGIKDIFQFFGSPGLIHDMVGGSQYYTIEFYARFKTGHMLRVTPETATLDNNIGLVGINTNSVLYEVINLGVYNETLTAKIGDYTTTIPIDFY